MLSKNSKLAIIIAVYLAIIVGCAMGGHALMAGKPNMSEHESCLIGGFVGVVVSALLWIAAGKKWVNKA